MLGFVRSKYLHKVEKILHSEFEFKPLKIESTEMSDMKDDLQKFCDLEMLGIKEHETLVYDKFSNDITFTGERYQVKPPFKDNHPMLPDID